MRLLYWLLTHLAAPFVVALEGWRELRDPSQRGRLRQRLGLVPECPAAGCLWIHAVSVGEVQAAVPLVRELRRRIPDLDIVLTTVTATGAQRAKTVFGADLQHCYLPYDLPGCVRRFLDRVRPRAVVVLETEIWPVLYRELGRRGIALAIVSARISQRSLRRYRRVASFIREALSGEIVIGAQSEADAGRFAAIGAPPGRVRVTGNVKFDLQIPPSVIAAGRELRRACAAGRPVWIAGSTHEGEESAAIAAHVTVRERHPSALLLLVPRHPQRFDEVRALLRRSGLAHGERSGGRVPSAGHAVFLVDTIGELQMFYAASDVAFVGGSLVPVGGHSLLEPAMLGLPLISGPHTHNAPDVTDLLAQAGALATVRDDGELAQRVIECLDDPAGARARGELGRAAAAANRGAVDRVVGMVLPLVSPAASAAAASSGPSGSR